METENKTTEIAPEKTSKIITDIKILGQNSTPVNPETDDAADIINQLKDNIPQHALGLAAPQLGILKRMFMANLSKGQMVFINPIFTWLSPDHNRSTEGCLSIPNTSNTIQRHAAVRIRGVVVTSNSSQEQELFLKGMDAFIVQHEMDHLDGKLITDYPKAKSFSQVVDERSQNHQRAMIVKRHQRKAKNEKKLADHLEHNSIHPNNLKKIEQRNKSAQKNRKNRDRKKRQLNSSENQSEINTEQQTTENYNLPSS